MKKAARKTSSGKSALMTIILLAALAPSAATAAIVDPEYTRPILDPATQNRWLTAIPNALMPAFTYTPHTPASAVAAGFPAGICGVTEDCYTISARQFTQGLGLVDEITKLPLMTTVNGYGTATNAPATGPFVGSVWHSPSPTIKSTSNRPYRVTWVNELPNNWLPGHDPTVEAGPNAVDNFPYNRMVVHMHGAHVQPDSDGHPEAWYSPQFALTGTSYSPSKWGPPGTYRYENTQEAGTTWYHDHASGVTHLNTQMGMAGFSVITDNNEKCLQGTVVAGCANPTKILPTDPYEVGFALQDRTFWPDGSINMPDLPIRNLLAPSCLTDPTGAVIPSSCPTVQFSKAADGHLIPYDAAIVDPLLRGPFSAVSTSLEYFGNMPMVNGVVYGKYDVEPRVYRMRFIGGTDSRTWGMQLVRRDTLAVIPFWQIGSEQGFLNNPVSRTAIDLMPGERVDVLVNLKGIPVGTKIVMKNIASDMPYGGPPLDPLTASTVIPEIMEFTVTALNGAVADVAAPTAAINLRPVSGAVAALPAPTAPVRNVSLIETVDQYGRTMPTIDNRGFMQMGLPITEQIKLNDVEQWDIINTTVDAHPIHLHLVAFQVINRQALPPADPVTGATPGFVAPVSDPMTNTFTQPSYTVTGPVIPPPAWEAGWKDTIDAPPGMVTRVKAKFDIPGSYVWHCHILSHEEHDMMRPFKVNAPTKLAVFRNGQFYRDMNGNGSWDSPADSFTWFGLSGDLPVAGDWDGSGTARIAVFRNGQLYRDLGGNGAWDGTDSFTWFGIAGDKPVAGDWNGLGTDKIGVFRNGQWFLDMNGNAAWDTATDAIHRFGIAGDIPVTGDWNGTGKTNIGVVRTSAGLLEWYLDMNGNGAWDQGIDMVYVYGVAGDTPLTGDPNGTGKTRIGVFKNGSWTLDTNGDGIKDAGDYQTMFGITGDTPLPGKW